MSELKLTKLACEILLETIRESKIPPGKGLRLEECDDGLTLKIDRPSTDDQVIKKDQDLIIIVNRELEKKIGSATIDIRRVNKELKLMIITQKEP